MPSNYAHRIFGDAVYSALSPTLAQRIEPNLPLFRMGLHGPDLLFYYMPLWKTPLGGLGNALHYFTGREVIGCMLDSVSKLPEEQREAGMAYTLGFVCHYLLDSACHPYVVSLERAGKASHCTIEGEFDLWLIAEEGNAPFATDPVSHLKGLETEDHEVIAVLFAALSKLPCPEAPIKERPRQIASAYRWMLFLNRVFSSPQAAVRSLAYAGFLLTGTYEQRKGMVYKKAPDPTFDGCSGQLYALLMDAAAEAPVILEAVTRCDLSRRFDADFGG